MTATLELGHTYSPALLGIQRAYDERRIANFFGNSVIRVALIDDIAVKEKQRKSVDPWRWQMFMNRCTEDVLATTGVESKDLYYESGFEKDARALVEAITDWQLPEGYRVSQNGRRLISNVDGERSSISLRGFRGVDDQTYPSCEVLDLAWLQKRLSIAPEAITILPSYMEEQQNRVNILAGIAGIDESSHTTALYIQR
jgi:hypothetical protein